MPSREPRPAAEADEHVAAVQPLHDQVRSVGIVDLGHRAAGLVQVPHYDGFGLNVERPPVAAEYPAGADGVHVGSAPGADERARRVTQWHGREATTYPAP